VTSAPTVADVDRIAAIEDRVIRNLRITQCYADLSAALRVRLGGSADWCTFATWASRQAGATIRGEDLLDRLERDLGEGGRLLAPIQSVNRWFLQKGLLRPDSRLGRMIAEVHTPFDAFERASEEVARGNLKVFQEIGREVSRFLATVPADSAIDSPDLSAFIQGLRPGAPPEGQDYLAQAFTHYQRQRTEADPDVRAAWILLANLLIGLHEQTRLQPQIAAAIDSPVTTAEDLGTRIVDALLPGPTRRGWHRPLAIAMGWIGTRLQRDAAALTRQTVTECMMVLALPSRVLHLGSNLDAPVPAPFDQPTLPPLIAFIREYDLCPGKGGSCGADDWCDLRQRMHYILHLFRSFAQDDSLFTPPFAPAVMQSVRRGVIPEGEL
jgi:hypothetical protein